jgi:hypothetical protein
MEVDCFIWLVQNQRLSIIHNGSWSLNAIIDTYLRGVSTNKIKKQIYNNQLH